MTPGPDTWWSALVDALDSIGAVSAREPHGLIVSLHDAEGAPCDVEVVMTPDEWIELVSVGFGVMEEAVQYVRELLLEHPREQHYLTYSTYELVPSATATPPVDPDLLRLEELARQYPGGVIPGGGWWANPPDAP